MHVGRTKITPPPIPAGLVPRPSLLDVLDRGTDRALTLVCAPPGYGKSVLLAEWVRDRSSVPTVWVNVEADDEDPRRFWGAVLSALCACPAVPPESRLRRLAASRTSVEHEFLVDLVDALDGLSTRLCLVLDDAHHLAPEALHGLQMLMTSARSRIRLVLAARHDPVLPVARMRLEERLCELRAEQLRFSSEESARLLEQEEIRLTVPQTAILHDRTGGWPAGLRLAALQLRNSPDPATALASFSGDERPVADYLVGEVLVRLTEDERQVLRSTCICDPVPARLAVELSDRQEAAELLDRLERDTGLVTGVDPQRSAFRVQRLLRSYLLADLRRSGPDHVAELQRRAARWCAAEGRTRAALYHAVRAADTDLVDDLVRRSAAELMARGEHDALLRALPAASRKAAGQPVASGRGSREAWRAVVSAQRHQTLGERAQADAELARARRCAPPHGDPGIVRLLLATERLGRLGPFPVGDHARPHDEPEPEPDDPALAATVLAARASARLATGAVGAARADAQVALQSARRLGLGLLELQCLSLLSSAAWAVGDYPAAAAAASAGVRAAALGGWENSVWACAAHAVSAHTALMRGDPGHALRAAEEGLLTTAAQADPVARFALRVARGAALSDNGDTTAGLLELQQARAELGGVELPGQLATTAAVLEHRAAVSSGHLTAAAATASWLSEQGIGEFELRLMKAWAEAATGGQRTARAVVHRLLAERPRSVLPVTIVEAALLDATVALRDGDRATARGAVCVALRQAEQLDAVRPFALAEPQVRALLVDHLGDVDGHHAFAYRAFTSDGRARRPLSVRLSAREHEVLEQLPSLRNLDEIADHLAVSVNTVKSHVRAIYSKLGVSSRRTAVLAAHEQGLLV
jgi:LuxR family maltose regulon positive regulatory protein